MDDAEFPPQESPPPRAGRPLLRSACNQPAALPISPETKRINKMMERSICDIAFQELVKQRAARNGGKKQYKDVQKIVAKYQQRGHSSVTRHALDYRFFLQKQGKQPLKAYGNNYPSTSDETPTVLIAPAPRPINNIIVEVEHLSISDVSAITTADASGTDLFIDDDVVERPVADDHDERIAEEQVQSENNKTGGRKSGSTNKAKAHYLKSVGASITKAAQKYSELKAQAGSKGRVVKKNTLRQLLQQIENADNLKTGSIKTATVISRIKRNNHDGSCYQKQTPLGEVEPLLADWLIRLANMGEALTKEETMDLMDDLIRDSVHAASFKDFCERRQVDKDKNDDRIVGEKWYRLFMNRYKDHLKRGKCRIQDSKRRTWCTYEHFSNMYDTVYNAMVECGVAEVLDEETMFDKEGNEVHDPTLMYGRPTKYRLLKPERCLFVDEVGCNTNQKEDGHVGGEKFILAKDQTESGCTGTNTDLHFTVLAFTAGTGEAVMCAVILKSEKDIEKLPLTWKMGIDITKDLQTGETGFEVYERNGEENGGGAMIGGPTCYFNGKYLPCFVGCSPKASITSELLVQMMSMIEDSGAFPRSPELGDPFLLIDGHHSRTHLNFINWINDPDHCWKVCIGVPYGTHIWQPADSSELNGSFKMELTKAKRIYLKFKPADKKRFSSTDIIPILNMAWSKSLGKKTQARKAIVERGWGVLNYVLLDSPKLKKFSSSIDITSNSTISTSNSSNEHQTSIGNVSCSLDLATINLNGKTAGNKLDLLIQDVSKCEGRKRKYEAMKAASNSHQSKIDQINKLLGGVSSATLAGASLFVLDKDIADVLREKDNKENRRKQELLTRKEATESKAQDRVLTAVNKYKIGGVLNSTDMRALLKQVSNTTPGTIRTNSPLKTKIAELSEQYGRRKHLVHSMIFPFDNDSNVKSDDNTRPDLFVENPIFVGTLPTGANCTTSTFIQGTSTSGTSTSAEI
jgi:hypothetical protein